MSLLRSDVWQTSNLAKNGGKGILAMSDARSDLCRRHTRCRRCLEERATGPGAKAPSLAACPMSLPAKELSITGIFFTENDLYR